MKVKERYPLRIGVVAFNWSDTHILHYVLFSLPEEPIEYHEDAMHWENVLSSVSFSPRAGTDAVSGRMCTSILVSRLRASRIQDHSMMVIGYRRRRRGRPRRCGVCCALNVSTLCIPVLLLVGVVLLAEQSRGEVCCSHVCARDAMFPLLVVWLLCSCFATEASCAW